MKTSRGIMMFSAINLFLLMGSVTGYSEDAPAAPEAVVDNAAVGAAAKDDAAAPAAEDAAAPADAAVAADDKAAPSDAAAVKDDASAPAAVDAAPADAAKAAPAAPEMTEEQKTMMEHMKEYSTVNAHHDLLKSLAGTWKTSVKFWMDPNGKPEESEGTSEAKVIMGGRFVEQTFNGTAMGQPFEGRGLIGYDNLKKEYTTLWFDNMSTGIMTGAGQYDSVTKVLTAEGSMSCPITQETHRWYKDVTTFTDDNHYTYESFMKDKDGKEYKAMSITYTKVQS